MSLRLVGPHGFLEQPADFRGLAGLERITIDEFPPQERVLAKLCKGESFSQRLSFRNGKADTFVDFRVADDGFWILPLGNEIEIVQEPLPQHDDSLVARAQMSLFSFPVRPLSGPGDEVLIHDVTRN